MYINPLRASWKGRQYKETPLSPSPVSLGVISMPLRLRCKPSRGAAIRHVGLAHSLPLPLPPFLDELAWWEASLSPFNL
jgi:hypothetical protein